MFKHLEESNESYLSHMHQSLSISLKLLKASSLALIHSFLPDTFQHSASNICRDIIKNVEERTNA